MLDTSARLLRLLSLFQAQRYWSGAKLCERLEVTSRTLRRDIDRLRSLGYPVNSTSGSAGGYQLGAGATLPPLLLDDEEAVAVAVGLRTAASGNVSGIEEASLRALSKLQQVLPGHLASRVDALQSSILALAPAGPAVDAHALATIAGACRDREILRFEYRSRDGSASGREVEPHRLVHTGRRWYLAAWDLGRADWRTFRVDRAKDLSTGRHAPGPRFVPREPPGGDFAAFVARSISYTAYPIQAQVKVYASAEAVAEQIPPAVGILEPTSETTCVLKTGAISLDMFSVYLAMLGFDFEIQKPPELLERVRLLAKRFRRAAL